MSLRCNLNIHCKHGAVFFLLFKALPDALPGFLQQQQYMVHFVLTQKLFWRVLVGLLVLGDTT